MTNNGTYTGEIIVGEVDYLVTQKRMDYQLNAERMTDIISLIVADDRGKRSIIDLALPQGVPAAQFKKGEVWAIPVRSYWSVKSNQMRRQVRRDMPPFAWGSEAA